MIKIPDVFHAWFSQKQWQVRDYQLAMVDAFSRQQSTLLIVPTGGGKTLSGFLPALVDFHEQPHKGLHTLYLSPLKALTNDIERNLLQPVQEMGLDITIETRTGDTPSHKRQRQRKKPPNMLLTTPESLMLMLSYADAPTIFGNVKLIIIDEVHSFAHNKRGDFTALALSRLHKVAPNHVRFGLSATVAEPAALAAWLGRAGVPASLHIADSKAKPDISLLTTQARMPYGGNSGRYAAADIYREIISTNTSMVFVNTRAQAEMMFQHLWDVNEEGIAIAIYHGSLSKEQRRKTESMMAAGQLRAVVATSALELGIDWGSVDLVIQVGAPKGVSRLLQRIGRSNHRMDEPSRALLVPSNRFEVMECLCAIESINANQLDGDMLLSGSRDILPQFIMNCACSAPFDADALFAEITNASAYCDVSRDEFDALLNFTVNGGYALQAYERYQRLEFDEDTKRYRVTSRGVVMRHRQNIGTIIEAGHLKVKRLTKPHRGRILGTIEEYFAQQLTPGDTFLFSGQVLEFHGVDDMTLEAWPAKGGRPKIPSYVGGQLPLSTHLADKVRAFLASPAKWSQLPEAVCEWLVLQQHYSHVPQADCMLIEQFPHHELEFTMFYTFEGRKANQTLGMLLTRRMERAGLKPISFSITDYGLSIASVEIVRADDISQLFTTDILGDELEEWIMESPMLKRSFRHVASISGLTQQRMNGARKTMKQVTFSTDLIYDVLRKYDPTHILLNVTRADAERELLDIRRLSDMLARFSQHYTYRQLSRASPLAIPIVLGIRSERVEGEGMDALMRQEMMNYQAEDMMDAVRHEVREMQAHG